MKVEVYPLTCRGLDHIQDVGFNVLESSEKRAQFIENLETRDKKLKIESSLFQEMISSIAPQQVDDEESEDEADEIKDKEDNKNKSKVNDDIDVKPKKEKYEKGKRNKDKKDVMDENSEELTDEES